MTRILQHACFLCLLLGLSSACSKVEGTGPIYFTGACDASAAVALNRDLFIVANDEDNILRLYSRLRPGKPVSQFDLTSFLRPEKKAEESDIEAAAQVGDRIYWITSHGRNAKGKQRETRHRFFATTVGLAEGRVDLKPVGSFYADLLEDMLQDAGLARFNLRHAAELPPKSPGALNIEGLCATSDGALLIGFRNPVPQGKALVVPLLNPSDVIGGKRAQFGEPMLLDLDGLGIRSIAYWRDRYIIVAGPTDGHGASHLCEWLPGQQPQRLPAPEIEGLNPEAMAFYEDGPNPQLFLLSDDGTTRIGNLECKKIKDPNLRRFRAVSILAPGTETRTSSR
jgi:hypothetical protein